MKKSLIALILLTGSFLLVSGAFADDVGVSVTVDTPECGDGVDNDSDLYVDYPTDPGCGSSSDDNETDSTPQCSDSLDNDSDGVTDFPADSGCDSALDTTESGASSGGGWPVYTSEIIFSGLAYSNGSLNILKNGILESEVSLGSGGDFLVELKVIEGQYTFVLIAYNSTGRSKALSFTVNLIANGSTEISNIKFDPFTEGEFNVPGPHIKGDLDENDRVNLIDFSIAAFWWKRELSGKFLEVERKELNGDGVVNIYDFSIMAFYWTG